MAQRTSASASPPRGMIRTGISLLFAVLQIFLLFQLTQAAIDLLRFERGADFATANPLAWIVIFLMLMVGALILRLLSLGLNWLLAQPLRWIFSLFVPGEPRATLRFSAVVLWLFWIPATLQLTVIALGLVSSQLPAGWISSGGPLVAVLLYFGILGLVYPGRQTAEAIHGPRSL